VSQERRLQKAASWYGSNGIPVFPLHSPTPDGCSCGKNPGAVPDDEVCRSQGKHPRTSDGFKSATTDKKQIAEWWRKWANANIGIPTGVVTQLLVIDSDPRNGGPVDRNELMERVGPIPDTAEVTTGGDGRHTYLRYPGGPVPKELAQGVDLKGDGGYVVAPPSAHASGKNYEWDGTSGAKALLTPAETPAWLMARIAAPRKGAPVDAPPDDRKWATGERNNKLTSVAGTMRRRGLSPEAIEAALLEENRQRCSPPLGDTEVRSIVQSVTRYEPDVVQVSAGWPEIIPIGRKAPDPIPAHCLPVWLGEMARAVSESTETPFEMAALIGLAVTSSCVAAKADVSPEPGYTEPVNVYSCPAMESGNRKTAIVNRMIAPLAEWERIEAARIEPERKRLLSERRTLESRIESLRKSAGRKGSDPSALKQEIHGLERELPEVPSTPRLFCDDITPERLAGVMQEQHGRIAIFSDEGGIFDILAGRYSKGIPNLDLWLKGHSVSPIRVDRQDRTRPPIIIDKPHLTVGISPQPDVLASLRDKPGFRGRGLLARFLYALPQSRLGYRALTPKAVPTDIETRYRNSIFALLGYNPDPMLHLHFTPEAHGEWKDLQTGLEQQFRDGGILEDLKDWGSKLPGAAARIAAIFHMAKYAGFVDIPLAIEKPTVVSAVELAVALIPHCRAVFALMDCDPEARKAERIVSWIIRQRSAFFTVRDCFRAHQTLFKRVTALTPTLLLLDQNGYVRIDRQHSSGGRPPSDVVEVNPALLGGGGA